MEPAVGADEMQLTNTLGLNGFANWGGVKTPGQGAVQVAAGANDRGGESTAAGPAVNADTASHGNQGKDKHKKDKKHKGGGKRHSKRHQ